MRMRKCLTALLLLSAFAVSACNRQPVAKKEEPPPRPLIDGIAAYENGNYADALAIYKALADKGDAKAENNLGRLYHDGKGVTQDFAEALKWFQQAAAQGEPAAEYNLGLAYENGEGVPKDVMQAMMWYQRAADQGRAEAATNLGRLYHDGVA